MSPLPTFELLGFEATPVTPAVAVVLLEGRFTGAAPARPRLLVEVAGVAHELPALDAGGSLAAPWSATFAMPLAALGAPGATFALAPARGPLIVLPPPSQSGADDDRFVRVARTANDLRRRLTAAGEAVSEAEAKLADVADERDALATELAAVQERLAAAERAAEASHAAAVAAREEQARAEGEADEVQAEAERVRSEAAAEVERVRAEAEAEVERAWTDARAEVADEIARADQAAAAAREQLAEAEDRAIAAEDEARAARRDLRDARARIESLHREARTPRSAAAHARVPSATPDRDDAEFRAARLGPEWDEAGDEPTAALPGGDERDDDTTASLAELDDDATTASLVEARDDDDAAGPGDDPTDPRDDGPTAPAGAVSLDAAAEGAAGDDPTIPFEPSAGDVPTTARLEPVEGGRPGLWSDADTDDSVRILRPRTSAGRLRPARVDPPAADDGDEEALDPAAVGARLLRPAETGPRHRAANALANPRVIVGAIFALLLLAIVLIFAGFGLV